MKRFMQNGAGYKLVERTGGEITIIARLDPAGEGWRILLYDRQLRQWVQPADGANLPTLAEAKRHACSI